MEEPDERSDRAEGHTQPRPTPADGESWVAQRKRHTQAGDGNRPIHSVARDVAEGCTRGNGNKHGTGAGQAATEPESSGAGWRGGTPSTSFMSPSTAGLRLKGAGAVGRRVSPLLEPAAGWRTAVLDRSAEAPEAALYWFRAPPCAPRVEQVQDGAQAGHPLGLVGIDGSAT